MTKTREMGCEDALRHLFDYLDQELSAEQAHDLEHHLAKCRGCYSRKEFEQRLRAHVREAGKRQAPESLRRRIAAMLAGDSAACPPERE